MRWIAVSVAVLGACKQHRDPPVIPPGPPPVLDPTTPATLPAGYPAIYVRDQGGLGGEMVWEVQLWNDGTIGFAGERCHGVHRGTVLPTRVAALATALRQVISDRDHTPKATCSDDFYLFLRVGPEQGAVWMRDGGTCDREPDPSFDQALALVRQVVSVTPCDPGVLTRPIRR